MSLRQAADQLGWPDPEEVLSPTNEGARALLAGMQEKFQRRLSLETGLQNVNIGLLIPDERGESTPAPIAVVCEFDHIPSTEAFDTAHRIAWNYSKAPVLLTVDPASIRAWTCCEIPKEAPSLFPLTSPEIKEVRFDWTYSGIDQQIASTLHWVNLISGNFFAVHHHRFDSTGRLDQALIGNLKSILIELYKAKLPHDIAHDLLGRVIFIQFLFQRTDSSGNAALNASVLQRLAEQKTLRKQYQDLASILGDYEDTYRFFRWLNERFNGDLFPGKASTEDEREREWKQEMDIVHPQHLNLLSEFVGGRMSFDSGQRSLFPLYSFDTIPLEFISSIYEEFVSSELKERTSAHFTPGHVVDLVLDGVLPWGDSDWNLKILDPACGSGIFIVKAFQRLVHRWKVANPGRELVAADLKSILENNIFGVDINPEAVRVASFSLYLAMCDEIDPRYYWTKVRFPRLRRKNLHSGDFFELEKDKKDLAEERFDLIIGNAPWGQNSATTAAKEWATANGWSLAYGSLGPLFLARGAQKLKSGGIVSMLQPTGLLTNSVQTAKTFRKKLFNDFKAEEVINLSALRFGLFANAVDPSCIITLRSTPPDGDVITYICPKPNRSTLDDYRISIDPNDVNFVRSEEAAAGDDIWTVLIWGSRRDLNLTRKLSLLPNLSKLKKNGLVKTREGIIRGNRKKRLKKIVGRRILEGKSSGQLPLVIDPNKLPINRNACVDGRASTDFSAFTLPQLIVKQGWTKRTGRFEAALVQGQSGKPGILCSQSYVSVSCAERQVLQTACAVYNSTLSVYYLLLTSGRFSSYRPESTATDLLKVPLPENWEYISKPTRTTIDRDIAKLFKLSDSEWALIHDLFAYTLPDFKGDAQSPGRLPTNRNRIDGLDQLGDYGECVMRVLRSSFGKEKNISCTIYEEEEKSVLSVRMILVHLDAPTLKGGSIQYKRLTCPRLLTEMKMLARHIEPDSTTEASTLRSRVVRVYTMLELENNLVPTIVIIKPDQVRYWSRSAGLRDADEIAADFLMWSATHRSRVLARA